MSNKHWFSNDTEYRIWRSKWCDNCTQDVNEDCVHIDNMLLGQEDLALTEVRMGWYDCSDFEKVEGPQ